MPITVAIEPPRQAAVLELLRHSDEYAFALYPADSCYLLDITELEAPHVSVFVGRRDATVAGIAALVLHGSGTGIAELKRLFVADSARGHGVAGTILQALEEHAAAAGIAQLRLETGALQPEAIALYEKRGYRHVPRFGQYVNDELSVCMEKTLA
ncbi:putative acetyltransferase [Glaciihabitans tibetensis]|uniref:Putative acetyltransferase n=1 Tax=Glaciihabitans tibetensis TaxID=1266600 RepID=A0A2T0VBF4_9MICO|nr:GNAT family N-acetyltransferase [Glaciihabitans tibetensis]PRY67398.1 putative acetyltransferase [Glaciihabitans tibetensis]